MIEVYKDKWGKYWFRKPPAEYVYNQNGCIGGWWNGKGLTFKGLR